MIVAVEGLDGSGKTTVAHALTEMLHATYIPVPPPEMRLVVNSILESHDSLARYLHYLASVASLIETAQREKLVVADRFVASAHALHIHVAGEVAESLRKIAFPCADLTIYLHVAEDERRARLARRGVPLDPFERKLNEDDGFRRQVAERLQGCPRTHLIDTTGLWPSAVAEQAWEVWRVAGRCGHSGLGGRQWSR